MSSVANEIVKCYVTLSLCIFHVVNFVICANVFDYLRTQHIRFLCLFCDNILFVP